MEMVSGRFDMTMGNCQQLGATFNENVSFIEALELSWSEDLGAYSVPTWATHSKLRRTLFRHHWRLGEGRVSSD